MKLLKKLLPVATIASSIACVAPIMTACGNGGIDITKKYTPSIKQHDAAEYNEEAGISEYFTQAAKNSEIIVQDYYWSITNESESPKGVGGSVKMSNVSVNTEKKVFSCTYEASSNGSYEDEGVKYEGNTSLSLTLTDIPYKGYGYDKTWYFYADSNWSREAWLDTSKVVGYQKGWAKIGEEKTDIDTGTQTINKTTELTDENVMAVFSLLGSVSWESYYFATVTRIY